MTYQNLVNPDGSIADFASNNVATAERLNLLANINAAAIADLTFRQTLFALTSPSEGDSNQTNLEALASIGNNPAKNARKLFDLAETAPAIYPAGSESISPTRLMASVFRAFRST